MPKLAEAAKEQRRQHLIDAAWRGVTRGAYRILSVDDVCAEAGLSKGAFYTYFDQKQDLLLALLDEDAAGLSELVADAANQPCGIDQIHRFVAAAVDRGSEGLRAEPQG